MENKTNNPNRKLHPRALKASLGCVDYAVPTLSLFSCLGQELSENWHRLRSLKTGKS